MKKFTLLFALLCASVMGWAQVTYSGSQTTTPATIEWSITWNANQTLTFDASWDQAIPGVVPQVAINNAFSGMSQSGNSASYTTTSVYQENEALTILFYFPYENSGLAQVEVSYTVGQTNGGGGGGSTPTGLCGTDEYENNVSDDYKIKLTSTIIDGRYIVRVESAKDGKTIDRVFTDNIWCNTSNGNLQIGLPANHRVIDGKLYFIIPSNTVPKIYTGDGVYVYFSDNTARAFPSSTYNLPLTECSDEVDYGVDFAKPTISAASLVSKTSAQAVISVTATDNVGVTGCAVYDGTAHLGDYALVDGKITVTELMYNHAYTLTIKAKDAMGNVSASGVDVAVATDDNTEIVDTSVGTNLGNMALSSAGSSATATTGNAGAALDNNTTGGSRWESAASDPQVWTLDLGQQRVFNNVQIVWEGAYGKTFTLAISDDNTNWTTVHYVKGQSLAGFPYEQSIDLPQLKARYIRFHGIERGTGYGYSFWEFRVFFTGEPAVLSTIAASIDKRYCPISTGTANISLSCKDQYNQDIDPGEVTYTISPDASYGTVTAGVFTPAKPGLISITAQSGLVVSNTIQIWGTSSTDLAKNKLHSSSTGETVLEDRPAANAVDDNDGTEWQSHAGTADTDEAKIYDAWLIIDLVDQYDIELLAIKFEGACSKEYVVEFSDDLAHEWKQGCSYSGPNGTNARRDEYSSLTNNTGVRYVRFFSTKAATQYGMKVQDIRVFGTVAASPTKVVSAAVNDQNMGTATVKQNNVDVTEVTTGTEVTFSAVANDGYIFVDWSNGNTNATFNATVDAAMNLTANFRALGNIYCNTEVTSTRDDDVHIAYATMKRTSTNNYKLVVRSAETLGNFSNTTFNVNGGSNLNLNNQGTLTDNNHVLTCEFESTTPPSMTSGYMYINVPGSKFTECWFTRLTNIEYEVACDDDNVPVESISLNYSEATIEIEATKTLVVTFNPVYASNKTITWTTTDGSVASVDGGVVTANAEGTATITAETANGKTATCDVTVEAITAKTCWGVGNDFTYNNNTVSYNYSITRNTDKTLTYTAEFSHDVAGLGFQVNVHNNADYSTMTYNSGTKTATFTTTETFETDYYLHGFFYFGGHRTDYYYTVASVCAKQTVDVTGVSINHTSATLAIDEHLTLTAEVVPANADDKEIIWENSDETVASFNAATGEVVALTVGTTTITAKSHFDENIYATCVVTVAAAIEPATWYGYGTFTPEEGLTGFTYSITRNTDRSLTYSVVLDKDPLAFVGEVNIEGAATYHDMSYNTSTRTATYTTAENFAADGDELNNGFWWLKSHGGNVDRVDFDYTVGSSNDALLQAVGFDDAIDNASVLTAHANQTVAAIVNRTFPHTDEWYTLCLPFDMTDAQLTATFGAGYTLAEMTGSEDRGSLIHLNFDYIHALEAGKPYMFKPGVAVTENPIIEGVTIQNIAPISVNTTYMNFVGLFEATTLIDENQRFVGAENYLYSPRVGGTPIKAFRCFFTIPSSSPAPAKRARVVFDGEQTVTGIDNIEGTDAPSLKVMENGLLYIIRDGRTYNAQGQLIK